MLTFAVDAVVRMVTHMLARTVLRSVGAVAVGYLAGTFPSADIVARGAAPEVDPRTAGSGNPGAANVSNLLGKRAGGAVFGLDMGKAVGAARAGRALAGSSGANAAAAAAVVGHCFPVWNKFVGGKGVAASFGQMLATFPAYLPVDIALGAAAAKSDYWKKRPVANIATVCSLWTALSAVWWRRGLPNLWGGPITAATPLAAAVSSVAIVYRFATEARTDHGESDDGE